MRRLFRTRARCRCHASWDFVKPPAWPVVVICEKIPPLERNSGKFYRLKQNRQTLFRLRRETHDKSLAFMRASGTPAPIRLLRRRQKRLCAASNRRAPAGESRHKGASARGIWDAPLMNFRGLGRFYFGPEKPCSATVSTAALFRNMRIQLCGLRRLSCMRATTRRIL